MNNAIKHQHEFTVDNLTTFDKQVIFAYSNEMLIIEIDDSAEGLFMSQNYLSAHMANIAANTMINQIFKG